MDGADLDAGLFTHFARHWGRNCMLPGREPINAMSQYDP